MQRRVTDDAVLAYSVTFVSRGLRLLRVDDTSVLNTHATHKPQHRGTKADPSREP